MSCFGLLLLLLTFVQSGCVTAPSRRTKDRPPLSAGLPPLAMLGTIGVISTSSVPKLTVQTPLNCAEAGELTSRRIVFLGGDDITDDTSLLVGQLTLGLSPWILSAAAVPCRVVAEGLAVPEAERAKSSSALMRTLADLNLQEELRRPVVEHAAVRTAAPVKLVRKPFPPGSKAEFSRMSCVMAGTLAWLPRGKTAANYLAEEGVDTVLELELVNPGLKGNGSINPALAVCVDVRARLWEAASGRELWRGYAQYQSARRKFTAWAANDAQLFRRELDLCFAALADQIMNQWVGQSPSHPGPLLAESTQQ